MMNFFAKLLTPVFIALGMVNPTPAVETPTPDIQVQQELIELRQKVQELETEKNNEEEIEEIEETETQVEAVVDVKLPEKKAIEAKKEAILPVSDPIIDEVIEDGVGGKILEQEERIILLENEIIKINNNKNIEEFEQSKKDLDKLKNSWEASTGFSPEVCSIKPKSITTYYLGRFPSSEKDNPLFFKNYIEEKVNSKNIYLKNLYSIHKKGIELENEIKPMAENILFNNIDIKDIFEKESVLLQNCLDYYKDFKIGGYEANGIGEGASRRLKESIDLFFDMKFDDEINIITVNELI